MKIWACDPGKRTGMAELDGDNFRSWEVDDQLTVCDTIYEAIESIDLIIIENYIITGQTHTKTQQHYSLEIIGCIRWACHRYGVPFILQSPVERKAISKEMLKKLGWFQGTKGDHNGHSDDAAMHLATYLMKQGNQDFLRRIYS